MPLLLAVFYPGIDIDHVHVIDGVILRRKGAAHFGQTNPIGTYLRQGRLKSMAIVEAIFSATICNLACGGIKAAETGNRAQDLVQKLLMRHQHKILLGVVRCLQQCGQSCCLIVPIIKAQL